MVVGEDGVEGEVAADKEASPGNGKGGAREEDVVRVEKASAVGARGVVRGGGSVTDGVVSLEGVPSDNLKGGALEAS
jgi:hypothetical protein